jgi:hypothetical protein
MCDRRASMIQSSPIWPTNMSVHSGKEGSRADRARRRIKHPFCGAGTLQYPLLSSGREARMHRGCAELARVKRNPTRFPSTQP